MKVIITTMDNLPEYYYNCPCCSSVGRCRADEKRRKTSEYRPYWCPLSEEKEETTPKWPSCDMCGKVNTCDTLTTINDNLHVCKDCERWLIDHCTKSEKEQLHMEEEKICVTKCDRCGKILARKSLTTMVKIAHGGTSTVNYPHNGEFTICKECERWLINELAP